MSRAVQFNRPVEYDPSLLRQQQQLQAQQQQQQTQMGRSASLTKEQVMKDEFGFDGDGEEQKQRSADDAHLPEHSQSRIRSVTDPDGDITGTQQLHHACTSTPPSSPLTSPHPLLPSWLCAVLRH